LRITFLGAAGEVTGSSYLVETGTARFLVDCGLFQGGAEAAPKNLAPFPFELGRLDFVLVTHAHLDHCGLLPRLTALGYRGPIHATAATADLLPVMLKDSAHIHEREAEWKADAPLYTVAQAEACTRLVDGHGYDGPFAPHPDVSVRFRDAGHILGAAIAEVWVREAGGQTKIVFSGDLGQPQRPLVRDPTRIEDADVLLVESTYGNRNHKSLAATIDELVGAVADTFRGRGGNVIVPAFALGRTQDLLVLLAELTERGRLAHLKVFVDSPLAASATEVTLRHADLLDASAQQALRKALRGELPLQIRFTENVDDSKSLNAIHAGAIIVAASGMCDAGRVKHHLVQNLGRPECSILFTGFQARGTLGRQIVDGARSVRIFREEVPVRARVHTLGGLSAHADRDALLGWLGGFRKPPRETFVVHGELETAHAFAETVRRQLGWRAAVPTHRSSVELR
jgi:metallo-beta-lactamase family protein